MPSQPTTGGQAGPSVPRISTEPPRSPRAERSVRFPADQITPADAPSPRSTQAKRSSIRNPRVIRTFEEVEVAKIIQTEEWYEELECGVCSHILGSSQALVPCGHSFCGPCAWQWIRKNKNFTCPHCRVELDASVPYVPNIVLDQVIDRKLKGLEDKLEKVEMMTERQEKIETFKMLQASLPPSKNIPKRTRGIDDVMFNLFDFGSTNHDRAGHNRRASRHLPALGDPIPQSQTQNRRQHLQPNGPHLSELRRQGLEEDAMASRLEIRRLRETLLRETLGGSAVTESENDTTAAGPSRDQQQARPRVDTGRRSAEPVRPSPERAYTSPTTIRPAAARAPGLRSQILAARQARGRGGSRDSPLVVLSDSDSE